MLKKLKKILWNEQSALAARIVASIFLVFLIITLLSGCVNKVGTDLQPITDQLNAQQTKITELQNQNSNQESRITTLENQKLTREDILEITNPDKPKIDTSNVTQGCPSAYDVDVKWFDAKERGDIDEDQYDTIKNKYNSDECQ